MINESNRLRLKEVIYKAKYNGMEIADKDLAKIIFPSDQIGSSSVSFYKYRKGMSYKVDRETVLRICNQLKCTPNELFGWPE